MWDSRWLLLLVGLLIAMAPVCYRIVSGGETESALLPAQRVSFRSDDGRQVATIAQATDWTNTPDPLSRGPFWMRLDLPEALDRSGEIVLQFDNPYSDRLTAYTLSSLNHPDSDLHPRTGQEIVLNARSVRSHLPVVRIKLAADDPALIYVHSEGAIDAPNAAHFWKSLEDFRRAELQQVIPLTLYVGLWFALLVYNTFVLVVLRDRVVLLYLFHLLAVGGLALIGTNFSAWFFHGPCGMVREVSIFVLLTAGCTALVQFSRHFLETPRLTPRVDRGLRVLLRLNATGLALTPLLFFRAVITHAPTFLYLLAAATVFLLPSVGGYLWWRRCRQAPLYVIAFACFGAGLVWMILSQIGYLPEDRTNGAPFLIGSALELLLLAIAVPYRYRIIREEQEHLRATYTAQLEHDVAARTQELSTANADKDRLISLVAHDIRSPLATLKFVSHSLARQPERRSAAEITDVSDAIRQQCDALLTLVDNVLDWGRLRTGHFTRDPASLNVAGLAEAAIEALHPAAKLKALRLTNEIPPELEIYADGYSVQCVLRNLVSNAIKFTASGSIALSAKKSGATIAVLVEDTGIGIAPEQLAGLNQTTAARSHLGTAGESGIGIGLALCRELAEREGGTLRLESPRLPASTTAPGTVAILSLPSASP